jgi:catechol 2,3-dioxygenase-like lactoylglutathione lyase family enzyme
MAATGVCTFGPVPPIETYGLTHLGLTVADPGRSARFYQEVFGCVVSAGDGVDAIELQTPGRKDVISMERGDPEAGKIGAAGGVGHFGFRLVRPEDIDAAVDAVLAAGGTLDGRGEFAPGFPYAFVRDLDGYQVEIWFE